MSVGTLSACLTPTVSALAQAQGELIQEVMAWHIARAKLKQAQGLLALECGYTPENPWTPAGHTCRLAVLGPAQATRAETAGPELMRAPVLSPLRAALAVLG